MDYSDSIFLNVFWVEPVTHALSSAVILFAWFAGYYTVRKLASAYKVVSTKKVKTVTEIVAGYPGVPTKKTKKSNGVLLHARQRNNKLYFVSVSILFYIK